MKRVVVVIVPFLALSFSCAEGDSRTSFDSDAGADASSGPFQESQTPCEDAATHVYVLSDKSELYRFRPGQLAFEKVGVVDCNESVLPNSMAVDRFGTAWVNYKSGHLFRVSTRNAACQGTTYEASSFTSFGSAFATNGPGSTVETLFADGTGGTLSKIDLTTLKSTKIGSYTGSVAGIEAELSGTGDGRLYGFFTTKPNATLASIDPLTGATTAPRVLDGVDTGAAYAFSFWGGDFWFYTSKDESPSTVTRLHTDEDRLEVVVPKAAFRIVGAGVSTCAPLTPPR